VPIAIYVFGTSKKLNEYRQLSTGETKKAKEGAATRHWRKVDQIERGLEEEDYVLGEKEMRMGWASIVEGESDGNK